jgi:hypothetical protein
VELSSVALRLTLDRWLYCAKCGFTIAFHGGCDLFFQKSDAYHGSVQLGRRVVSLFAEDFNINDETQALYLCAATLFGVPEHHLRILGDALTRWKVADGHSHHVFHLNDITRQGTSDRVFEVRFLGSQEHYDTLLQFQF